MILFSFFRSIGFFLHFEKPGQLSITKNSSIFKTNVDDVDVNNFFLKISEKLIEKSPRLDFFVPLGSSGLINYNYKQYHIFSHV
jgi:hypothetical protein